MDSKEMAEAKRSLGTSIMYKFREFEDKTGLIVTGIRIKRSEQWVESVTVNVDVPDLPTE